MSDPISEQIRDLLTLRLVNGLGPRITAALLERFGSPGDVLRASPAELAEVAYVGPKLAQEIARATQTADLSAECELMTRHGVHLRALGTPEYPASLAQIPDPPHLLYVRGELLASDEKAVALVGSRQFTSYGRRVTERLATDLVRAGYVIVSGLARGIDGIAHRAALKAGGRTIAVMAGGLSRIYPPEHKGLADEVVASGALVCEAAMRSEPMPGMFPARNRIISALSRGVVIIEAAEKSGALITAEHAAEQGRTTFAVPGPIDSESSSGTNALIRDGAILIRGAQDIIEELEGICPPTPAVDKPAPTGLDATQQRIWEQLNEGARHLDELVQRLSLPVPQMSGALMMMEMRKIVRRLPGNRYERI
jgi:DNA processing protein